MQIISASILAANHVNLQKDVLDVSAAGGDRIHVDIMDGHYVKNITFGPKTVEDLRKITNLPIDVHLEMYNQENFIEEFISVGADMITIQFESCKHPLLAISQVKKNKCNVSLAIAPTTSVDFILPFLHELDEVNIMSVEPGFGGQKFREEVFDKIIKTKEVIDKKRLQTIITVDGGLDEINGKKLSELGVFNFVVGNRLFLGGKIKENIESLKQSILI